MLRLEQRVELSGFHGSYGGENEISESHNGMGGKKHKYSLCIYIVISFKGD